MQIGGDLFANEEYMNTLFNLRDSLEGTDITVKVGLRENEMISCLFSHYI